jgi:ribonuclease HI
VILACDASWNDGAGRHAALGAWAVVADGVVVASGPCELALKSTAAELEAVARGAEWAAENAVGRAVIVVTDCTAVLRHIPGRRAPTRRLVAAVRDRGHVMRHLGARYAIAARTPGVNLNLVCATRDVVAAADRAAREACRRIVADIAALDRADRVHVMRCGSGPLRTSVGELLAARCA